MWFRFHKYDKHKCFFGLIFDFCGIQLIGESSIQNSFKVHQWRFLSSRVFSLPFMFVYLEFQAHERGSSPDWLVWQVTISVLGLMWCLFVMLILFVSNWEMILKDSKNDWFWWTLFIVFFKVLLFSSFFGSYHYFLIAMYMIYFCFCWCDFDFKSTISISVSLDRFLIFVESN